MRRSRSGNELVVIGVRRPPKSPVVLSAQAERGGRRTPAFALRALGEPAPAVASRTTSGRSSGRNRIGNAPFGGSRSPFLPRASRAPTGFDGVSLFPRAISHSPQRSFVVTAQATTALNIDQSVCGDQRRDGRRGFPPRCPERGASLH
jgi:hypothetical protein